MGGAWLLAGFMARVYAGERTPLSPVLAPVERGLHRAAGVSPDRRQGWTAYATAALAVNAAGFALLYAILRLQGELPLNPDGVEPMSPNLAFTEVSFVTNTNWQAYSGEAQLGHLSQMAGLTAQNFGSAATGMAVAVAVVRGFGGPWGTKALGDFWVDMTRSVLHVLLPLSVVLGLFLAWQGAPQTLRGAVDVTTLEGAQQVIARGPAASQGAIKQLGTNGGGFFGVNSAQMFENPTVASNMAQCVALPLIPLAFAFLFGRMVGDPRQGWAIFAAMGVMFVAGLGATHALGAAGNPLLAVAGPNMEGKEQRFGAALSSLWAASTTAASNGSVNAIHDSFMPISGLVMMVNMQVGEMVFDGVGADRYRMLHYVVPAVFLAGLMVGRTPEYLGRKIEGREVTLAVLAFLSIPLGILVGGAVSATVSAALASVQDPGSHGRSEILNAYSSATGNNGSAFEGWGVVLPWQTTALGVVIILGRFAIIAPMLAIAGSLARKTPAPAAAGTFPTHAPLFVTLLVLTVLILGALTFFPVLVLGPVAKSTALAAGRSF